MNTPCPNQSKLSAKYPWQEHDLCDKTTISMTIVDKSGQLGGDKSMPIPCRFFDDCYKGPWTGMQASVLVTMDYIQCLAALEFWLKFQAIAIICLRAQLINECAECTTNYPKCGIINYEATVEPRTHPWHHPTPPQHYQEASQIFGFRFQILEFVTVFLNIKKFSSI